MKSICKGACCVVVVLFIGVAVCVGEWYQEYIYFHFGSVITDLLYTIVCSLISSSSSKSMLVNFNPVKIRID